MAHVCLSPCLVGIAGTKSLYFASHAPLSSLSRRTYSPHRDVRLKVFLWETCIYIIYIPLPHPRTETGITPHPCFLCLGRFLEPPTELPSTVDDDDDDGDDFDEDENDEKTAERSDEGDVDDNDDDDEDNVSGIGCGRAGDADGVLAAAAAAAVAAAAAAAAGMRIAGTAGAVSSESEDDGEDEVNILYHCF